MTRVLGFEELQSEMSGRDPCSSFMTESAWPTWGVPLLLTCLSVFYPKPFDRLRKPDGLSWVEIPWLGLSKSHLGRGRATCAWWCFGSRTRCVVVVGHTHATSRLTRHHSIGQGASHQSGCIPLYPIRIEWGKGEGFSTPVISPFPDRRAFPNCYALFFK